ncbi:MAG: isoprenylcysteine carboxylmethyltransferase family protein [Methylophilaceae bacterium]
MRLNAKRPLLIKLSQRNHWSFTTVLEVFIFVVGTLGLAFVSRLSLRKPGSHGFYRFFAWESMLLLFVLNFSVWHVDINAPHQVIAGFFFLVSLLLVIWGVVQLRLTGKPDSNRNDVPMLHFEKTTVLVTTGIYRHIRHPIYGSLFLLCWGFFFKNPSVVGGVIAVVASGFLVATARVEEAESIRFFGEDYRAYMRRSKMLVPFVW